MPSAVRPQRRTFSFDAEVTTRSKRRRASDLGGLICSRVPMTRTAKARATEFELGSNRVCSPIAIECYLARLTNFVQRAACVPRRTLSREMEKG